MDRERSERAQDRIEATHNGVGPAMRLSIMVSIIGTLASAISCESLQESYYRITVINSGVGTIYFYEDSQYGAIHYPDTSIKESSPIALVRPGTKFYGLDSRKKWETIIDDLPADTLSFFFFDSVTVSTNTWDVIRSGYLVKFRYDLSIQDLQKLNFEVPVPPSILMQGMKVYSK